MSASTPPSGTTPIHARRRWYSLSATCTAAGLVWLAFADLGVAIPTIADQFHANLSTLQWANNAFSLVTGALVIAAGRFADIFGRRRLLEYGVVLFALASIVAALAESVEVLIIGRALMGIGAAAILPATLAVIPVQFAGRQAITAFGLWQAVAWGGQAIGPAIGGAITSWLSWQWLFWINIPLGLVAVLVMHSITPESKAPDMSRHVDWLGLIMIGLSVFCLLYALTDGPTSGWGSPLIIGLFIGAVVFAVGWWLWEKRAHEPLVDLRLFSLRPYDGALTANTMMNLAFAGLSYLLVLWLQNVRGYGAVEAGLLMLPSTVGIFAFIPLGGRLSASRGSRQPVLFGLVVLAGGLALLAFLAADSSIWMLAAALLVVGTGLGLLSTPISTTAVGDVSPSLAGAAAGVFKMSSMVGGALGVAVLSAFTRGFTEGALGGALDKAGLKGSEANEVHAALVNSSSFKDALSKLPNDLRSSVTEAATTAFSSGIAKTMVAAAVLCVLVVVLVAVIWPRRLPPAEADATPASGAPASETDTTHT